jgi:hypothetical protein
MRRLGVSFHPAYLSSGNGEQCPDAGPKTKSKTGKRSGNLTEPNLTEPNRIKAAKPRFIPPSFEEVEAYCSERSNHIDPQAFIDYYTSNGWKVGGKAAMKCWKAAVRTWERNDKARKADDEDEQTNWLE